MSYPQHLKMSPNTGYNGLVDQKNAHQGRGERNRVILQRLLKGRGQQVARRRRRNGTAVSSRRLMFGDHLTGPGSPCPGPPLRHHIPPRGTAGLHQRPTAYGKTLCRRRAPLTYATAGLRPAARLSQPPARSPLNKNYGLRFALHGRLRT